MLQSWGGSDTFSNNKSLLGLGLGGQQGLLGTGLIDSPITTNSGLSSSIGIFEGMNISISTTPSGNGLNLVILDPLTCNFTMSSNFGEKDSQKLVDFFGRKCPVFLHKLSHDIIIG